VSLKSASTEGGVLSRVVAALDWPVAATAALDEIVGDAPEAGATTLPVVGCPRSGV